jgi:hypothetical protein
VVELRGKPGKVVVVRWTGIFGFLENERQEAAEIGDKGYFLVSFCYL